MLLNFQDLEEDEEMRKNVNVYKDSAKFAASSGGESEMEGNFQVGPQISLSEMLDDLAIDDEAGEMSVE